MAFSEVAPSLLLPSAPVRNDENSNNGSDTANLREEGGNETLLHQEDGMRDLNQGAISKAGERLSI